VVNLTKHLSEKYEQVDGLVIVDKTSRPDVSMIGQRGDSIEDLVPRGFMFYTQFLKEFYFMRKIKNTHTVVDVGCGTAALLEKLYRNGSKCKYIGIDISESALKKRTHISSRPNVDAILVKADFSHRIPLNDNVADVVILSEVIEHFTFEDGEKLLYEIKRILKHNGLLLLTTTNGLGDRAGHLLEYEFNALWEHLRASGFKDVVGAGLYIEDVSLLTEEEKEVLFTLKEFYPKPFLLSLLAFSHYEESRSYLIQCSINKDGGENETD